MIFRGGDGRGDVYVSSFISIVCDFCCGVFFLEVTRLRECEFGADGGYSPVKP